QRKEANARARSALEQAGDVERELAEEAMNLAGEKGEKEASLPKEVAERLGRAGSVMREAARELSAQNGERGVERGKEAQRLLEQSGTGRSSDPEPDERSAPRQPQPNRPGNAQSEGKNGDSIATGGDVPSPDDRARAEEFRRRVLEGLSGSKSER